MKNYKFFISRFPIIFFIIGILGFNILSPGFISILGLPLPPSTQLAYSTKGDSFEKEDSDDEKGDGDSKDKSLPTSSPANEEQNEDEEGKQEEGTTDGSNPPYPPPNENDEPPSSFQNPRLVPTIPLVAGTDDEPTLSIPRTSIPNDQLLPLQTSNLCSNTTDCAGLRIQYTSNNIPSNNNNTIAINIQRNNQSIGSFTLNGNNTLADITIDPGQYDIIADMVNGSTPTAIIKMTADCSGSLRVGETKTCLIIK